MNFVYENQGTNTFLVYTINPDDVVDTLSLGMLTNNKIQGLAPTMFIQMNSTKYIRYNVTSKVSVSQLFAGPVNRARLLGVFQGIVDAILSAEEYMIDTKSIIIDTDYIFSDVATCETVMICVPVLGTVEGKIDLGTFFRNIVFSTQYDQTENCDHVAAIINYLNRTPIFSPVDFKTLLDNLNMGQNAIPQNPVQQQVYHPVEPPVQIQPKIEESNWEQVKTIGQNQNSDMNIVQKSISVEPSPVGNNFSNIQDIVQQNGNQHVIPNFQGNRQIEYTESDNQAGKNEKQMSVFYLLQHYNKENIDIYKAQRADKKGPKDTSKKKKNSTIVGQNQKPGGFAIPGQQQQFSSAASNQQQQTGFAIPGQQPSISHNQHQQADSSKKYQQSAPAMHGQQSGFAIPEQKNGNHIDTNPQIKQNIVSPVQTEPSNMGNDMDFGDTIMIGTYGDESKTIILGSSSVDQQVIPHLIRKKNNERIPINKTIFRLGRDVSFNDYVIADNKFVGHGHCHIITRDGEYFIVDDNSKNHTYVDGVAIPPSSEVKLSHGQNIRLSNEEFEFRLF